MICSLEAALVCSAIGRMAPYEPPIPTAGHAVFPPGSQQRLRAAAAAGDPETILQVFFSEVIELPDAAIDAMRGSPTWAARLRAAPTLVREGDAVEAYRVSDRLSSITVPVRLSSSAPRARAPTGRPSRLSWH